MPEAYKVNVAAAFQLRMVEFGMRLTNASSLLTNGLKLEYSYGVADIPNGYEARISRCGRDERNWFYFLRRTANGRLVKSTKPYRSEFEALDALRAEISWLNFVIEIS